MGNDFYHLPHQLMASGLERLMKCYISVVYEGHNGTFPDMKYMKRLGHDLVRLLDEICNKFYDGTSSPLIQQEFAFITTDKELRECIRILSLFGKLGRYYNLDIVAGSPDNPIDPKREWEALERSIEDPLPYVNDAEALYRDYYPRVHARLIAKLERLVRAIARQFTLGDHPDQNRHIRQASGAFSEFRDLGDDQLGTTDYRRSVRILQQQKEKWLKRSEKKIRRGRWPTQVVTKDEFDGEWPFRSDRVIVECREKLFYIVNIEGYAFALNGLAKSRFKFPSPHDSGLAVLGKSTGPFIDMASALAGQKP